MPVQVVIVGGGFGGLYAAKELRRAPAEVTVLDRHNYHLFQPLLYQVATAALSPGDIAYPIRGVLHKQRNTRVLLAEVTAVDVANRRVILRDGSVDYDYLIVAAGAVDSYFGHTDWQRFAPSLKTLDEALEIRSRILLAFERAEREPARRDELLTFVIVGGGPTGVELAGAIAEIATHVMARDFRSFDPRDTRVVLVEVGPRILPTFDEKLARAATDSLRRLGVRVESGAMVTEVSREGVTFTRAAQTEHIRASTVLWAAGVTASGVGATLGEALQRGGRVAVEPDLSLKSHPEIFVIGDLAYALHDGKPLPGLAPVALQQGRHAAKNIMRSIAGKPRLPFHYLDKGTLATIGRASAVADIRGLKLSGWLAWLVWIFVHIMYLIGFRNRFIVAFEWAWAYLTYERAARLITANHSHV